MFKMCKALGLILRTRTKTKPKKPLVFLFVFCVYLFFLHARIYIKCMPGANRSQKGLQAALELEFKMVVRYYVSAGN